MASSSVPVDLMNPGQVFACLGILEIAELLLGDAVGAFDWREPLETTFHVAAAEAEPPVERVMRFLEEAHVVARAPSGSTNRSGWKSSWGASPEVHEPGDPFPFPDPPSPATLPVTLRDDQGRAVTLDYWADATRRDNVKFWAGAAGYPAAAIVRDAVSSVRGSVRQHASNPFELRGVQTNSFRFDWRRDYIPVQDGFSPNKHAKDIQMIGFPLVELLAAVGMSNARPRRETKLEYRYGVLGCDNRSLLSPVFHRAALGAVAPPIPGHSFRCFVMQLDWPGKEGQARCITQVFEEETEQ